MTRLPRGVALVAAIFLLVYASLSHAQDSFGGSRTQSPLQGARQPSPQTLPQPRQAQGPSNESQDFGVAPTQQLRPSNQLGGPTPTSIPGGRVIATQQLAQLLQGGQSGLLLLHAYGGMQHLPGATAVGPASQGGSFDDQVQREFGQYLQQVTQGDQSRALVFYCGCVQCWGSYNAALRAIRMGYRNVAWYRGGIEAWQQAGLPVLNAGGQGAPQAQSPQAQPASRQW